jgi:DNA (cytosine-5)-methyltransferase 1
VKILNLYAGIGGNRKLWGEEHKITAVEIVPEIAAIYKDFFPNDEMIITDAHQYLLEHYKEYDFIWSSPPCPTHSRMNHLHNIRGLEVSYPDMKLYEEILLLKHFAKCLWLIENVKSYYKPLVPPYETARHYFWSNFAITNYSLTNKVRNDKGMTLNVKMEQRGIIVKDFHGYSQDKRTLLNNCIEPELGLHILNCAIQSLEETQQKLF